MLTQISLASFLWDMCEQNSPRFDATKCSAQSGAFLFAYRYFIKKQNKNENFTPAAPSIENGLAQLSLVMRKPDFCICENKDADQLRSNQEADQRLGFRYIDSKIPLVPKYEISSL